MNAVPLLRNSERTDFRRCPQRWHWRWNEYLVPIELNHGPLVFGTFGHLALAEWYKPGTKRGPHPAETWDRITEDFMDQIRVPTTGYIDEDTEMSWEDARSLGHDLLVNYVDYYGTDDHWEVLWVERPGDELIRHPYDKSKAIVRYAFTMDLIVRDHAANGRIRYVDHKFMKAIEKRHLWIDSQNGGYLAIGTHQLRKDGVIGPKEAVRDLVYNFVRKARYPDKERNHLGEWLNKDGTPSKRQPPPFFDRVPITKTAKERNQQIVHIGNEALHMKAFRDGRLPLHKNPSRDCAWDCSFFTLCGIHESGGDVEGTKKVLFRTEDPYQEYKDHSKSTKTLERRLNE
ncbi:exonuclease [Mycobacterium phage Indlulamithi]|uniref:Exonuclease n=1 Tax=Mycobacterium phage Indlulamithi TaxID=2656582 RepID=A0A649VCS1_9CAUD|nr:exonuclease [Mycobacterium phage Indlulamithi]QGJ90106.1 exonuclease [Mycobacterium phage Indlulamithi]